MKKLKKRFIIPAVVFILGMCALIGAIYVVGKSQEQQNRTNAKLNAMTYTERIYGAYIWRAYGGNRSYRYLKAGCHKW